MKNFSKEIMLEPIRRCLNKKAVENISLRRFRRRVTSFMTGHLLNRPRAFDNRSAPPEYSQRSQTSSTSTSQTTACLASRLPIRPSASHVSVKQTVSRASTFTTSLHVSSHPLCTPAAVSVSKEQLSITPQTHTAQAEQRGHDFSQSFPSDLPRDLLPPDIWTSSQATYDLSITYSNVNNIRPAKGFYERQRNERDSVKIHGTISFERPVTGLGLENPIIATTDVRHELSDNDESLASCPEVWFDAVDMLIETADVTTSSGYLNATICCTT